MIEDFSRDYYSALHVNPRASIKVIEAAYKALRKEVVDQPDNTDRITELVEAFSILSKPEKRKDYDDLRYDLLGKTVRDYRILSLISDGDLARVYKAEHILLREPVCIKQCKGIAPEDDEKLINEAKSVWNLRFYTIPAIKDLFRLDDGSLTLIRNFIPGVSLREQVQINGVIEPEKVCWTTQRILEGLYYLHFNQVIHGGIEPANIIGEDENHLASLIDYKFSVVNPAIDKGSKGFIPFFAAPEQIQDPFGPKLPLLPQTDFYGLGKTMIYALTGKLEAVERNEIPVFVPEPLKLFIDRLTKLDPLERPNWNSENLITTLEEVREKVFGRRRSRIGAVA